MLPTISFGQWTDEQKALAAVASVALVIDYGQTRSMVEQIEAGKSRFERNPFMPRYPTMQDVNRHFIVWPIVTYLVLDNISSESRTIALWALTVVQVSVVAHNYSIGVRTSF